MHKPVLILFVLLSTSVCHLPYRMAGEMVIHSSIPKKFGFLWNQFLKSTVFYGINSKKVLFLGGFSNEVCTFASS